MIFVSNTGPIIILAKIQRLALLTGLSGAVYIPPEVHRELLAKAGPEVQDIAAALAHWIQIRPVAPLAPSAAAVLKVLDEGERQAIALARSWPAPVLLEKGSVRIIAHCGLRGQAG